MEHKEFHLVSDSGDEDDAVSLRGEAQDEDDVPRSPSPLEVGGAADSLPPFAVQRKLFLHGTASTLMLSRVQSLRELQGVIDDLRTTIAKLGEIRQALERASDLHACLDRMLKEDRREAEATIQKHSFSPSGVTVSLFSGALSDVADIFIVNMDHEQ
jgi:hypothetical protein